MFKRGGIFFYLSVVLLMILFHYPHPILCKMDRLKTDLDSGMFIVAIPGDSVPLTGLSAGLKIVRYGEERELKCR